MFVLGRLFFRWLGFENRGQVTMACAAAVFFGQMSYYLAFLLSDQGRPSCMVAVVTMVVVLVLDAWEIRRLVELSK